MRKVTSGAFIVLLGLVLLAGVSQAATLIDKDGFKFEVKGDWQIQLRQDPGVDQKLDVEYDDLEIKNTISYKINEDLSAFGQIDFGFNKAADDKDTKWSHLEEAYVGLKYQNYKVSLGKTGNAADEFGVEQAYENIVAEDAFDEVGTLDSDDLLKVEVKFDNFKVVASHEFASESENSGNAEISDIFVGAEYAGFELGAVYQAYKDDVDTPTSDADIYGVSLMYDAKVVKIGVDYSKAEDDLAPSNDQTVINGVVIVPVKDKTTIAAGYVVQDFDLASMEEVKGWYANATYKLHKNVHIILEVEDDDKPDSDVGYMAALRLKF